MLTRVQMRAVQKAMKRHWTLTAMSGLGALFGGMGGEGRAAGEDDTAAFEARVQAVKKATGRDAVNIWEVA